MVRSVGCTRPALDAEIALQRCKHNAPMRLSGHLCTCIKAPHTFLTPFRPIAACCTAIEWCDIMGMVND